MRQFAIAVLSVVCFAFAASANADFFIAGNGWDVSGFNDTVEANESVWSLTMPGLEKTAINNVAQCFALPVQGDVFGIGGQFFYFEGGKSLSAGTYTFSTDFIVNQTRMNAGNALAHVEFALLSTVELSGVKVNGESVNFDIFDHNQLAWFEFALGQNGLDAGTYTVDFEFDLNNAVKTNVFMFGAEFRDGSNISPEPGTLLILGLGVVVAPLARRFRRR
ncbi:MAG: PEP-CTERM sorting domain-containing protein [Thermoguttaceae bacterium]